MCGGIVGGQADENVIVLQKSLLADYVQAFTDIGQIQMDEGLGEHQRQIIGFALSQRLGRGTGAVIVELDVLLNPGPGGLADASFAGNGTGNGGFGYAQFPGNVVNGQITLLFQKITFFL